MIRIFNIHDPICATCEYWIEKDKNIGFQNRRMFIEYGHVQGKCLSWEIRFVIPMKRFVNIINAGTCCRKRNNALQKI